jgi:hypothetical protein
LAVIIFDLPGIETNTNCFCIVTSAHLALCGVGFIIEATMFFAALSNEQICKAFAGTSSCELFYGAFRI